jgi:hypothetical protein
MRGFSVILHYVYAPRFAPYRIINNDVAAAMRTS